MQLTRWDPFREMEDFSDRLNRALSSRLTRPFAQRGPEEDLVVVDWAPLVDVEESDKEFLIKAELPEVRKEDVSVTVQDGVLTLSGERKQEQREENERVHRIERFYGSFARRFALPENADEQGIRAECRDGVIVIHIPKQKQVEQQPRQIQIQ